MHLSREFCQIELPQLPQVQRCWPCWRLVPREPSLRPTPMPLTQQSHHGPLCANKQASGMQKAQSDKGWALGLTKILAPQPGLEPGAGRLTVRPAFG